MKSSHIIALVIAVMACLWVLSGYILPSAPEETAEQTETQAENALFQVQIVNADAETYIDSMTVTGRTRASREVSVSAEVAGTIETLRAREGDNVQENMVIALLDKQDRQARYDEAAARLKQKELEYNAAQSLENRGFNSRIRLSQTEADLEQAQADLRRARDTLDDTSVKAPFAAVVYKRYVEKGDYVSVGTALFDLVDLSPLETSCFVTEQQIQRLEKGQAATLEFLDGQIVGGKVTYIAPAADPQTRTFEVKIQIDNPDNRLKDGMTAKVTLPLGSYQAYKISPSILVLNDAGEVGVNLVDGSDAVHFHKVKILADEPGYMWVGGLPPAVRMITVGQNFVKNGQTVTPVVATKDNGLL